MSAPPIPIDIAVEDPLSESVAKRLLAYSGTEFAIGAIHRRGGYGYLRKTIGGWNEAAKFRPILVLTDLDDHACPPALIENWLKSANPNANLMFRVAVREIEAWLLADWNGITEFLRIPKKYVRTCPRPIPESLTDPKAALIELGGRSQSREIKLRVVPSTGSTARVGREYNDCMCEFVDSVWDPKVARGHSESLDRSIRRLSNFRPTW